MTGPIQDHASVVLGLLTAALPAEIEVHDGRVPDDEKPPYVLVYFGLRAASEDGNATSLDLGSDRIVLIIDCHSVGGSARTTRTVAGHVRAALLDVEPQITGRVCWPIRHDDGQPPQRDERTGVLVQDQLDQYRLESVPRTASLPD